MVVEGVNDKAAVLAAVSCAVVVTNGTPPKPGRDAPYKLRSAVLRNLAACEQEVIIFSDPDSAGRAMRSAVAAVVKPATPVRHAFVGQHLCRCAHGSRAGVTGVEYAAAPAIVAALAAARPHEPARQEFTRSDLEAWGLAGRLGEQPPAGYEATGGVAQRRNDVAAALGIGPCDGKTFLKYANEYGFARSEVEAAVAALEAGRGAASVER